MHTFILIQAPPRALHKRRAWWSPEIAEIKGKERESLIFPEIAEIKGKERKKSDFDEKS